MHSRLQLVSRRMFSSSAGKPDFDLIVVGGGMVGAAMGAAIAQSQLTRSLRVAVIDAAGPSQTWSTRQTPASNRVVAIAPSTARFLETLGAWDKVEAVRAVPYTNMTVWDSTTPGSISFSANEGGIPALGYIVENHVLHGAVTNALKSVDGSSVELILSAVDQVSFDPSSEVGVPRKWATVRFGDKSATCRLVIGADGQQSKVRQAARLPRMAVDYGRNAVVGTVTVESTGSSDSGSTAFQRFLPNGPLAVLPLEAPYGSIVWSTTHSEADRLVKLSNEEFAAAVNEALHRPRPTPPFGAVGGLFDNVISSISSPPSPPRITGAVGGRAAFPLGCAQMKQYTAARVALVGDAAHTIHPLAGLGVNMGLADVQALSKALDDAVNTGMDIGDARALKQYEDKASVYNATRLAAVEAIRSLFESTFAPLAWARGAGLSLTDHVNLLKKAIVGQATGSSDFALLK